MVQNERDETAISLVAINYSISATIPSNEAILNTFGAPRQCEIEGK